MEKTYDYEETLLVKVAWYYYIGGLTQQEIGEHLEIPRLRVNRLLDKARKCGVIHFSVREHDHNRMTIEQQLIRRFHLKDVFVVPTPQDEKETTENVAHAAAMYLNERISKNIYINMGYGDTTSRILNHLSDMSEFTVNVVSLTGGVNYYLPNTRSSIFNARLFLTPAPLLMKTPEMADAIKQEDSVRQITSMVPLSQFNVIGIGGMNPEATLVSNGMISGSDFRLLSMKGAVGDILCHFIDKDGCPVDSEYEARLISTPLDSLRSMGNIIGVAAGATKVPAILGTLRGSYIDVLITDEQTAQMILSESGRLEE